MRTGSVTVLTNPLPPLAPVLGSNGAPITEVEEYERLFDVSPFFAPGALNAAGIEVGSEAATSFILRTESFIARVGAKSELLDHLVQWFPQTYAYVEPFMGSLKVLLGKPFRNKIEMVNDIYSDMVHLFIVAAAAPDLLCQAINALPMHEALIMGLREALGQGHLKGLTRAVAAYMSIAASFNGKGTSYGSSVQSLMDTSIDLKKLRAFAKRMRGVDMRSTSFTRIIRGANKNLSGYKPYGKVLFYCDPPYWKNESGKLTTGYYDSAGTSLRFGWPEQEQLFLLLNEVTDMGNLFLETNSYSEDLIGLYQTKKRSDGSPSYYFEKVRVNYSMSGSAEGRGEQHELVISNFPLKQGRKQGGLFA